MVAMVVIMVQVTGKVALYLMLIYMVAPVLMGAVKVETP